MVARTQDKFYKAGVVFSLNFKLSCSISATEANYMSQNCITFRILPLNLIGYAKEDAAAGYDTWREDRNESLIVTGITLL
jgi:hypothetical protein